MRRTDVPTLLFSAALALVPAAALADTRAQKYYYEDITQPFFALDPADPGFYRNQRPGSKASRFAAVKPKDGFRVFVIGGSIAGLLQHSDDKRDLAQALKAVLPTKKVEVINCGMAGYESFREAMVEQEILEYSPDLIVLLTGHNEGIASAPIPIWVMRAQERLSRLTAYRTLVKTLHPENLEEHKHSDAVADARDATFTRNLSANVRHAKERGVSVAVVVPPRNYREPVELGRTFYDAEFIPGWLSFLHGDYAASRHFWKESLAAATSSEAKAFTWGFIARSEEKLGLADEARASFEQASAFDRAAICGKTCQDIIRRVTGEEGGFLVEADRMFRELAMPGSPGMETFNDRMHWKPQFNCLMASVIIDSARADAKLGALPWDDARVRALKASCEKPGGPGNADDDLRILSYVLMELSWPNRSRLAPVAVFYLQSIRRHRPEWFKDVRALMKRAVNPQTQVYGIEMAADEVILPRFYWYIGEVRMLEKDYAGAVKDIEKALALDPKLSWARLSLAVAETLRGDKKRGLQLMQEATAKSAEDPQGGAIVASAVAAGKALGLGEATDVAASDAETWIKKAEAAVAAGKKSEGTAALDRARELSPQPYQLRAIGQYYLMLGEPAKFLELADALAAAYPEDIDTWILRAEASLSLGRKQDGLAALARAKTLSPTAKQEQHISNLLTMAGASPADR